MQYNVIGIKFKNGAKVYSFDPKDIELHVGDNAIVETNRGLEYGTIMTEVTSQDESNLVLPLKPVIRKATDRDKTQYENNTKKSSDAMTTTQELITKLGLDMKLVDIEYVFDGSKVIINFVSDNRVDFRDLVRELAIKLKARVELRQIGIRDQSKTVGGIGICGRPCCCSTFLNDFEKVSIKMAKNQSLSLNPAKISGLCGRLMCCLEYENPYYAEVLAKMPKINSTVSTPEGKGTVVYQNILKQIVSVKIMTTDEIFSIKDFPLKDIRFDRPVPNQNVQKPNPNKQPSQAPTQGTTQPSDIVKKKKKHKKKKPASTDATNTQNNNSKN